jgi:hypothetical protein
MAGMSTAAIIAVAGVLVILGDLTVWHFEILWHRPDRQARTKWLEVRAMLVAAVVLLLVTPYALIEGRFWPAAGGLFGALLMLSSYRRNKQEL